MDEMAAIQPRFPKIIILHKKIGSFSLEVGYGTVQIEPRNHSDSDQEVRRGQIEQEIVHGRLHGGTPEDNEDDERVTHQVGKHKNREDGLEDGAHTAYFIL